MRDYKQADGSIGSFQKEFAVYGREGEPCSRTRLPGHRAAQDAGRALDLLLSHLPALTRVRTSIPRESMEHAMAYETIIAETKGRVGLSASTARMRSMRSTRS